MKHIDVKSSTYIDSNKEINNRVPKFKVVNNVRISKYKNVFAKGYVPNWSEEVFVIKKVESTLPWMLLLILKKKKLLERFTKTNYKKTNQKEFRNEELIKSKGDKLCVKKGYDRSFNSLMDKKDIV